ncbi:Transporter, LysE family [Caballeronia sordidicola]|uniref:Transporter, LysE family n=1 Tax=Caballeronia sordidicola TaxID=196367 RepID=A0A226X600_CABSO|nr:Transporter, LysE family [Caballeronia sordidicola]
MAAFALATSISPRPVNIVALSAGAQYGLAASMRHVAGATFGFALCCCPPVWDCMNC